jgi:thymidylate kinase
MKRPLLVTVSGMVGTGKTTAIRQIADVMQRKGIASAEWRFQRLLCITLRPRRSGSHTASGATERRGVGYQSRRLTAFIVLGHLVRIIAFRVFRRWPPVPTAAISDRYFYDSLAHYELGTRRERIYSAILRRMIPKPDVAFLMVASPQAVAMRRPQYTTDYLQNVAQGYDRVLRLFPELIEITSEPQHKGLEQIGVILEQKLASRAQRLHRTNNHPAGTAAAS